MVVAVTLAGVISTTFGKVLVTVDALGGATPKQPEYYVTLISFATVILSAWTAQLVNVRERIRWAALRDANERLSKAKDDLVIAHQDAKESERRAIAMLKQALFSPTTTPPSGPAPLRKCFSTSTTTTTQIGPHQQVVIESVPIGQLDMQRVLGEGAFGEAILCDWWGRLVVLKRMPRGAITTRNMKLFADELRMHAQLRHPNVIELYGACYDDACNVGFVLEYAVNGDLLQALEHKAADWTWADPLRRIALDVARGCAYLHDRRIFHRDIKSKNCLLTSTFSCKIADFGLSSEVSDDDNNDAADEGTTRIQKSCVGTPCWMGPELIRGDVGDEKADVYAYGITLVEMANKAPPYSTAKDKKLAGVALLAAVDAGLRPAVVGDMPPDVLAVKDDCLKDAKTERPSFREILNRLVIDGPPDTNDASQSSHNDHGSGVAFVADSGSVWFDDDVNIVDTL